jgi:hypothetical protein
MPTNYLQIKINKNYKSIIIKLINTKLKNHYYIKNNSIIINSKDLTIYNKILKNNYINNYKPLYFNIINL